MRSPTSPASLAVVPLAISLVPLLVACGANLPAEPGEAAAPAAQVAPIAPAAAAPASCTAIEVTGAVAMTGGQGRPIAGATIAFVPDGSTAPVAIEQSGADGRFRACVPAGRHAVTATAAGRMAAHVAPRVFAPGARAAVGIQLDEGGAAVSGRAMMEGTVPPGTYARFIRASDDGSGEVLFAAVGPDGRFEARLFDSFDYTVDVVGPLAARPVPLRVRGETALELEVVPGIDATGRADPAVRAWIRGAARSIEPEGADVARDATALAAIVGEARVVGLGENSHGAGEHAAMRNRLFQVAVSQLGFDVLAIEANFSEVELLDEYVQTGRGDPAALLAGLHLWITDTRETARLVEWMRRYNADPSHARKVKLIGVDMQRTEVAYRELARYLARVDRPGERALRRLLAPLGVPDGAGMARLSNRQRDQVCDGAMLQVRALDDRRSSYVARTGERPWRIARQHAVILWESCMGAMEPRDPGYRDRAMAENTRWILETEGPGTRVLLWAHDNHVSPEGYLAYASMGKHLREALGPGYVTIGQYFGQGSFRAWSMEGLPAERGVRPVEVGPPPAGYLEATLTGAAPSPWLVDLRRAPASGPVREWLRGLHHVRDVGAVYRDEEGIRAVTSLQGRFDAIVFHDRVTAARPNPTGRRGPGSR